ncbi:MAG TPA: lectin [Pseudonocardiaceae bacterium]
MKRRTRLFGLAAGAALALPMAAALGTGTASAAAAAVPAIFPSAPYAYTDTGTNLANYSTASGEKDFTIAFVLAGNGCQASWNGDNTVSANPGAPDSVEQEINALRSVGGNVSISFGGADGTYLDQNCTSASSLAQQYENVIAGTGTSQVDFDIEQGYGDQAREQRVAQAVAMMQSHQSSIGHPVAVTYTLGVGTGGLPTGSGSQYEVAQYAVNAGVTISAVNIMVMDYGPSGIEMGNAAESAATGTEKQLETLFGVSNAWSRIGLTPDIGPNDSAGETYTLADANNVESFASSHGIGYMSFWEMGRDNPQNTGQANWAYTHVIENYGGGGGTPPPPPPGSGPITSHEGSNLCLDVRGANSADGTPVQVYTCNGTSAQSWSVNSNGTLTVLGKCLDVSAAGTANGTLVQLYTCNGTGAQSWSASNGELVNTNSGKCLDDTNMSTTPGTQSQIWSCAGTANQLWTLPSS